MRARARGTDARSVNSMNAPRDGEVSPPCERTSPARGGAGAEYYIGLDYNKRRAVYSLLKFQLLILGRIRRSNKHSAKLV